MEWSNSSTEKWQEVEKKYGLVILRRENNFVNGTYIYGRRVLVFKKILGRNIVWWMLLAWLLSSSVNWRLCTIERGKYLLGIFYNGHYQNTLDETVYKDYLQTHGITHEFIKDNI
jgi:hypothetical protein